MEISQRSTAIKPAMRVRGSMRPLHGAKADRQTVDRAGAQQREQLARTRARRESGAARKKTAIVFTQFEPDADRLGRIVLEQHRDAAQVRAAQACWRMRPRMTMSRA